MGDESRTAQIAIDGAAGAGKSTVGEAVAQRLGYLYIDSGAFYRALTVMALRRGAPVDDEAALLALLAAAPIQITYPTVADGRQYTVLAGGEDITPDIHTLAVAENVSAAARHPQVREALIAAMRAMAGAHNVVMVGRDIGLVVLPDATLKIALSAPPEERARRRHADLVADMGEEAPGLDRVLADIEARDARDARQMTLAADAVPVENPDGQFDAVVDKIIALLNERLAARAPAAIAAAPAPPEPPATTEAPEPPAAVKAAEAAAKSRATREGAYVAPKVTASREVAHDGTATPWFYRLARGIVAFVLPILLKLRVEGLEHVPTSGPVMLASNHAAWIDIPLVSLRVPRITHYMAKIELFQARVLGGIIRLLGAFPVRRGEGDRESLRTALRLLGQGEVVVIFPEGHRSGGAMIRGLPGVALIALRANAPIVPVAIINSPAVFRKGQYLFRRPTVTVRYGEPFKLNEGGGRYSKEDVERGGEEIMTRIAALLPPEYRGVYAEAVEAMQARETSAATR